MLAYLEAATYSKDSIDTKISDKEGIAMISENIKKYRKEKGMSQEELAIKLPFLAMFVSLSVKQPVISIVLSGLCIMTATIVLYRNLALLTSETTKDMRLKTLRMTTIFNVIVLGIAILISILISMNMVSFSEYQERLLADNR